jgi:hypothetical protein
MALAPVPGSSLWPTARALEAASSSTYYSGRRAPVWARARAARARAAQPPAAAAAGGLCHGQQETRV